VKPGSPLLAAVLAGVACRLARPAGPGRTRRRLAAIARAGARAPFPARRRRARGLPEATLTLPGPVLLDLVAAVLRAGAPVTTALRIVAQAAAAHGDVRAGEQLSRRADRHDLALDDVDASGPAWAAAIEEALLLARDAGVAVAPLLAAAAVEERRRQAAQARAAAARLGVRVVLPTGLCLLPAFVLLAIVPLVLALLGAR
jgi:tight adherence protein B